MRDKKKTCRKFLAAVFAVLLFGGWAWPGETEAYNTVPYYFQNTGPASSVCLGTSTPNQTASAFTVPPAGVFATKSYIYWSASPYHINWTDGISGPATSLADDMYLPAGDTALTVASLHLTLFVEPVSLFTNTVILYAKYYDVDSAATCPAFESGVLIGTSPMLSFSSDSLQWHLDLDGLDYNLLPGHRIRVELWVNESHNTVPIANAELRVGGSTTETTTLGPGETLPDATVAPGGSTDLDAFTFQTTSGTDYVGALAVYFQSGSWSYVDSVSVTSDDGTITYGTSTVSSMLTTVNLSPTITAIVSPVQYRVLVHPKSHASLSVGTYSLTGWVSAFGAVNSPYYGDSSTTTVTLDNQPPANPSWAPVTPADGQLTLSWTNPADADFSNVVILRSISSITDAPSDGALYSQGDAVGASTVRYVGSLQTFIDTGLSNTTAYYYKIFARDSRGNYSTGAAAGPYSPMVPISIGDGVNPPNATVAPGGAATFLDSFTLRTTFSPATITNVTVSLPPGTGAAVSLMEVTSDSGATVYGSTVDPGFDTISIPLASSITATTSETQYKIRVTPKAHLNLPAPPGQEYSVTGTVTAIIASENSSMIYSDSSSGTVMIDNLSPADPVWGEVNPGDRQTALNWTNSGDADFSRVVVLRNTSSVTDAPVEGTTYTQGALLGSSVVRYVGNLQTFTDTGLVNGTDYYYKIFAQDINGNYSGGSEAGPSTPNPVLTVGDGVNPSDTLMAPGASTAELDSFTLRFSNSQSGSCNLALDITVSLAAGTASGLRLLEITRNDGAVVYGSVSNPGSDTVVVHAAGGDLCIYPTSATQYKVRVQPKSHANMPPPPGAVYNVTGTVTGVNLWSWIHVEYNDFASAGIMIDNLSPGNPVWGTIQPGVRQIALDWTNPADADFSRVIILRNTASIVDMPTEGATYSQGDAIGSSTVIYAGNLQTFTDTGLSGGTDYYYRIFGQDSNGNYSAGSVMGPHKTIAADSTTVFGAEATAQGTDSIAIEMSYRDDSNANNTYTVDYKLSSSETWTNWVTNAPHSASPFTILIAGLAPDVYDVRMTFVDLDGVVGQNPQTVTGINLSINLTKTGTATASPQLGSIVVYTPFSGDLNHNNSCLIEYKASRDSSWMAGANGPCGSGFEIGGLSSSETYDVKVTYQDNDGVMGAAEQVISAVTPLSDKLIHNSRTTGSLYWAPMGWGIAGGMYGEFTCETCHMKNSTNISRIKDMIELEGLPPRPVVFLSRTGPNSYGDDTEPRFAPVTSRICEVCHTLTSGLQSTPQNPSLFGPIHQYEQPEPANHFNANGTNLCTCCHTHDTGFAIPKGPPYPNCSG